MRSASGNDGCYDHGAIRDVEAYRATEVNVVWLQKNTEELTRQVHYWQLFVAVGVFAARVRFVLVS